MIDPSAAPEPERQRASDADREAVIERLQAAVGDGRLDLTEFDDRMARAYRAKTFGELAPLTDDLGGPTALSNAAPSKDLVLRTTGSSLTRTGRWVVPSRVAVEARMGSTRLDLSEAVLTSREVVIDLHTSMGSVLVIVPDGTMVDVDGLEPQFGSVSVRTKDADPNGLRVQVTGTTSMGSVTVRNPGYWARRRLRRRQRKGLSTA